MKRTKSKLFSVLICIALCFAMLAFIPLSGAQNKANAEVIEQTGLGLGVNFLTADNGREYSCGISVFDDVNSFETQKVKYTGYPIWYSENDVKVGTSAELFIERNSYRMQNYEEVALLNQIKPNIEKSIELANVGNELYKNSYRYIDSIYRITNSGYQGTYLGKFSDIFLEQLVMLRNGEITELDLFKNCGTHITVELLYGAKADYYTYKNDNKNILVQSKMTGGKFMVLSSDDIDAKIDTWKQSVENGVNLAYYDGSNSFMPLWDILPDEYNDVAVKLKKAFTEEYEKSYNALAASCAEKLKPAEPPKGDEKPEEKPNTTVNSAVSGNTNNKNKILLSVAIVCSVLVIAAGASLLIWKLKKNKKSE